MWCQERTLSLHTHPDTAAKNRLELGQNKRDTTGVFTTPTVMACNRVFALAAQSEQIQFGAAAQALGRSGSMSSQNTNEQGVFISHAALKKAAPTVRHLLSASDQKVSSSWPIAAYEVSSLLFTLLPRPELKIESVDHEPPAPISKAWKEHLENLPPPLPEAIPPPPLPQQQTQQQLQQQYQTQQNAGARHPWIALKQPPLPVEAIAPLNLREQQQADFRNSVTAGTRDIRGRDLPGQISPTDVSSTSSNDNKIPVSNRLKPSDWLHTLEQARSIEQARSAQTKPSERVATPQTGMIIRSC